VVVLFSLWKIFRETFYLLGCLRRYNIVVLNEYDGSYI